MKVSVFSPARSALGSLVFGFLFAASVFMPAAEARRFDFGSELFHTYFGASYGPSNMSDHAFGQAAGAGARSDQVVQASYSGEIGIAFSLPSMAQKLLFRIGGEYLVGSSLSGIQVSEAATGTKLFELDSRVHAAIPSVGFEAPFIRTPTSRVSLGGGLGYAFVSLDQDYRMTPAGAAAYGIGDYEERASVRAPTWRLYLNAETWFVDTTTIAFELGYRSLRVGEIQSTKGTAAISGGQQEGSPLKNSDGSNRSFDMGGAYASISFRFYL
ncbi:MAG: hypothetical protein RBT63_10510 [Bdellovibrionales bacterium]|jgi:hypothetical protein|nr:hypothetical protein [Bdellovibrionales bacterium]